MKTRKNRLGINLLESTNGTVATVTTPKSVYRKPEMDWIDAGQESPLMSLSQPGLTGDTIVPENPVLVNELRDTWADDWAGPGGDW